MKVTELPAQMVLPGFAEMLTKGATLAFTVMVITLLVSVAGIAQFALLLRIQETLWPLVRAVVV